MDKLLDALSHLRTSFKITKPYIIDCENLRRDRQLENNKLVLECLNTKDMKLVKENCNKEELKRVLSEQNKTNEELLQKCDDEDFSILLAGRISKKSSRQGIKDEEYIISQVNRLSSSFGIHIQNLSVNDFRPSKDGRIVGYDKYKKMKKSDCLKSFDAKISGKISGFIFAKVTFSSGGHQDNVFMEAHQMCEWVVKYGNTDMIFVILIDTDLKKQFNELKNKYNKSNLLITNHVELQEYFINNF